MIGSISRRRTFTDLRNDGRRVRHGSVRISFLPLPVGEPQVAFAIGRSFGNAVERNRARRRLRAAFVEAWRDRSAGRTPPPMGAYQLTGGRRLLHERFTGLVSDITGCLDRLAGVEPTPVGQRASGRPTAGQGPGPAGSGPVTS